jgi:hypothetical protein
MYVLYALYVLYVLHILCVLLHEQCALHVLCVLNVLYVLYKATTTLQSYDYFAKLLLQLLCPSTVRKNFSGQLRGKCNFA